MKMIFFFVCVFGQGSYINSLEKWKGVINKKLIYETKKYNSSLNEYEQEKKGILRELVIDKEARQTILK